MNDIKTDTGDKKVAKLMENNPKVFVLLQTFSWNSFKDKVRSRFSKVVNC